MPRCELDSLFRGQQRNSDVLTVSLNTGVDYGLGIPEQVRQQQQWWESDFWTAPSIVCPAVKEYGVGVGKGGGGSKKNGLLKKRETQFERSKIMRKPLIESHSVYRSCMLARLHRTLLEVPARVRRTGSLRDRDRYR
eukprot:scaffold44460_cov40-Attheya_sp.AAC.1